MSERFAALKYRDFKLIWLGLFISSIGTQMQFAALNWHIYLLTNSPIALGLLGLWRFIPIAIFSLIGGVVADSNNRKKILFITQITLTVLSLVLWVSTFFNIVTPIIIYAVTALSAIAVAFDVPPRQAIIPSLVNREHLENAMSLSVIMQKTSMIIGPALSGIFIAKFGVGIIYFINAFSFIAVIAALLMMKTSGEVEGKTSKLSFRSIIEGLVFVKSETIIWSTMILDFFSTFFSSATAVLPIFALNILKVGPIGFGMLNAAPAIGAVFAGIIMAHIGTIKNQGKILLYSVFLYGTATVIFGFSKIFLLSLLALFFVGVGDCVSTVIRNTIRQLNTPDNMRGRMTSVNMIFFTGGPQLGGFEAGLLAALIGGPLSVVFGGVGTLAIAGMVALKFKTLRNYSS